jgi:TetR/AcrR family fatty acid metabolism transcriptional regulator
MTNKISERQYEIIQATGKILTQSGVSGLTIKNLATEMKFSESAIYRHFKSKEEIVIALLQYLATNMDERYTKVVLSIISPEEKLIAIFKNQILFFKTNPHFVVAVFSDGLMEESVRINETISKIMEIKNKHLLPIIKEGQQQNIFTNEIPTEDLIHIIMGSFRLLMFKWRASNFNFEINKRGNTMMQSILKLIKI